jgi:hypothetical protein
MIYRAAASKVKEMKKAPLLNVVWRPVAVASTHAIAGREEEVCDHFPQLIEHSFFPTWTRQSWRPSLSFQRGNNINKLIVAISFTISLFFRPAQGK